MNRTCVAALTLAAGACTTTRSIDGWEGFFAPSRVDSGWLVEREIPIEAQVVHSVLPRVVKLVLDTGTIAATRADLDLMHERYCAAEPVRRWNEDRCRGLAERTCASNACTLSMAVMASTATS